MGVAAVPHAGRDDQKNLGSYCLTRKALLEALYGICQREGGSGVSFAPCRLELLFGGKHPARVLDHNRSGRGNYRATPLDDGLGHKLSV